MKANKALRTLMPNIRVDIEDAVDFMQVEFEDDLEKTDRYFNGEVDLVAEEGRSQAVATVVRDTIRTMKPSIMRVFLSNRRRIVDYTPSNVGVAAIVEQQQAYVHQLFWGNNGYRLLYDAVDESLRHKFCATKTYWEPNPTPEYIEIAGLTLDEVQQLSELPDIDVLEVSEMDLDADYGENSKRVELARVIRDEERRRRETATRLVEQNVPPQMWEEAHKQTVGDELTLYSVKCERKLRFGTIKMEGIPYGEFFISRNATNTCNARVHGHRRSVTVAEAIEMGLESKDWEEYDDLDPQQDETSGPNEEMRGYRRDNPTPRGDILSRRFLLTECYVRIDLEDAGFEQLYCLYLGGTSYKLIDYDREGDTPLDVWTHDPRAFSTIGYSLGDILVAQQDIETSMLRGTLDNVHMANTPRLAANPTFTNFQDLMAWDIGAPIRLKGQGTAVQVIQTPSQVQGNLPLMAWLQQKGENTVGVTKAAQGLDPSAMQSTDKEAVQNTIALAQGQTELCVRNLIETGLISVFRKLLKLSIRHLDREQVVRMRGQILPVDQLMLQPDLMAEPVVGLGSVTDIQRMQGLTATLETQFMICKTLGVNNPFVKMVNIYNTLEDITAAYGLHNVNRYFQNVTPELEAAFSKQQAEASKKQEPMDPSLALLKTQEMKSGVDKLRLVIDSRNQVLTNMLRAIELDAEDDFKRDELAQERVIESTKLAATTHVQLDQNALQAEQNAVRDAPATNAANASSQQGETQEAAEPTQEAPPQEAAEPAPEAPPIPPTSGGMEQ